ncbi:hypothetical protein BDZ94DRAFT_1246768 [Collybia nuda]|uniref:Pheromone n=1 Tax=Collybia nuda TaxID=64659 RepID=A0A9P5YEC1_9AGAR|nr:hypothetical protein BDZ94DRAFT_1246768 [Collybia nuda]
MDAFTSFDLESMLDADSVAMLLSTPTSTSSSHGDAEIPVDFEVRHGSGSSTWFCVIA